MFYSKFLIATSIVMSSLPAIASGSSLPVSEPIADTLSFSSVIAEKGFIVTRKDTVNLKGYLGADEALAKIPGLLINDNGGRSGLKTLSIRGLGSAQTSIYIDGVRVSNLMSGQTDISAFSNGNFTNAVVDYAQSSISFTTAAPRFEGGRKFSARASFIGGSFGTYIPSVSLGYRFSDRLTAAINATGTLYDGYREDSQIKQFTGGIDFAGYNDGGKWKAKAYINASDRKCPGSLSYPYLSSQKDINGFVQGSLVQKINDLYTLNASAKIAHDHLGYKDDYSENTYDQTEIQINSSHIFKVAKWFELSGSVSSYWNGLKSDNYIISETSGKPLIVSRVGLTAAASASFRHERFNAELGAEYTGAYDRGTGIHDNRHCFSPSASLRFTAIDGLDIVAYGRKGYHIPTFNDLYYSFQGNKSLKAEEAWLTDIGVDWRKTLGHSWTLTARIDGFFNFLTDKISWAPSPEDAYTWLPYNIGKVRSMGTDMSTGARYDSKDLRAGLSLRYSYQDAIDRTPDSATYNSQIAYIPKHTVVICGEMEYKGWGLDATWNFRDGRLDSYGPMPSWNTLDINATKTLRIKDICSLTFNIMSRNITNQAYEVSSGYPMPRWALYGGLSIKF